MQLQKMVEKEFLGWKKKKCHKWIHVRSLMMLLAAVAAAGVAVVAADAAIFFGILSGLSWSAINGKTTDKMFGLLSKFWSDFVQNFGLGTRRFMAAKKS